MPSRFLMSLLVAGMLVLATGSTAWAQTSPTGVAYDETEILGDVDRGGPPVSPPGDRRNLPSVDRGTPPPVASTPPRRVEDGSSLPFTGLNVGILLLMGGVLVGVGVLLRRGTRGPSEQHG